MSQAPRPLKAGGGVFAHICSKPHLLKAANDHAWQKEAMRAFLLRDRDPYIAIAIVPNEHSRDV
jgi:hypothetical protein